MALATLKKFLVICLINDQPSKVESKLLEDKDGVFFFLVIVSPMLGVVAGI